MFVLTLLMYLIGVKINMIFLFLLSSVLLANEIEVHEINRIGNITLSSGSSITQGGLTITRDTLEDINISDENNSISQGIIIIDDNITGNIHYDIVNIIRVNPIEVEN